MSGVDMVRGGGSRRVEHHGLLSESDDSCGTARISGGSDSESSRGTLRDRSLRSNRSTVVKNGAKPQPAGPVKPSPNFAHINSSAQSFAAKEQAKRLSDHNASNAQYAANFRAAPVQHTSDHHGPTPQVIQLRKLSDPHVVSVPAFGSYPNQPANLPPKLPPRQPLEQKPFGKVCKRSSTTGSVCSASSSTSISAAGVADRGSNSSLSVSSQPRSSSRTGAPAAHSTPLRSDRQISSPEAQSTPTFSLQSVQSDSICEGLLTTAGLSRETVEMFRSLPVMSQTPGQFSTGPRKDASTEMKRPYSSHSLRTTDLTGASGPSLRDKIIQLDRQRAQLIGTIEREASRRKYFRDKLDNLEAKRAKATRQDEIDVLESDLLVLNLKQSSELGSAEQIEARLVNHTNQLKSLDQELIRLFEFAHSLDLTSSDAKPKFNLPLKQSYKQNSSAQTSGDDVHNQSRGSGDLVSSLKSESQMQPKRSSSVPRHLTSTALSPSPQFQANLPDGNSLRHMSTVSTQTQTNSSVMPDLQKRSISGSKSSLAPDIVNDCAKSEGSQSTKSSQLKDDSSGRKRDQSASTMDEGGGFDLKTPTNNNPNMMLQTPTQHIQFGPTVDLIGHFLASCNQNKAEVARTFFVMTLSPESCARLRESGCLPLIIDLIHRELASEEESSAILNQSTQPSVRQQAREALHNVVNCQQDSPQSGREIKLLSLLSHVRAFVDGIRAASEISKMPSSTEELGTVMEVIHTLRQLSYQQEEQAAFQTLGGVQALAELFLVDCEMEIKCGGVASRSSYQMRSNITVVFTNVVFRERAARSMLCQYAHVMRAFSAQLDSHEEELVRCTADLFRNLSWKCDRSQQMQMRELDVVVKLAQALLRMSQPATVLSVLRSLWNLSGLCAENKDDICGVPSAMEKVITLLNFKNPNDKHALPICIAASGVMGNLSSHIANRAELRLTMRSTNAYPVIVDLLKSPTPEIVENACLALMYLSTKRQDSDRQDMEILWQIGAPTIVQGLRKHGNPKVASSAGRAYRNLMEAKQDLKTAASPSAAESPKMAVAQFIMPAIIDSSVSGIPVTPTAHMRGMDLSSGEVGGLSDEEDTRFSPSDDSPNIAPLSKYPFPKGFSGSKTPQQQAYEDSMKNHHQMSWLSSNLQRVDISGGQKKGPMSTSSGCKSPAAEGLRHVAFSNNQKAAPMAVSSRAAAAAAGTKAAPQGRHPSMMNNTYYNAASQHDYTMGSNYQRQMAHEAELSEEVIDYSAKYNEATASLDHEPDNDEYYEQPTDFSKRFRENDGGGGAYDQYYDSHEPDDEPKNYSQRYEEQQYFAEYEAAAAAQEGSTPASLFRQVRFNTEAKQTVSSNQVFNNPSQHIQPGGGFAVRSGIPHGNTPSPRLDSERRPVRSGSITGNSDVKDNMSTSGTPLAQETPLMFSRRSSLSSLNDFETQSINSNSNFPSEQGSRAISGAVSPSDIPDSPNDSMSLAGGNNELDNEPGVNSMEHNEMSTDAYGKNQHDLPDEAPKTFATESTPQEFSCASSLSALSIDDHPKLNRTLVDASGAPSSGDPMMSAPVLPPRLSLKSTAVLKESVSYESQADQMQTYEPHPNWMVQDASHPDPSGTSWTDKGGESDSSANEPGTEDDQNVLMEAINSGMPEKKCTPASKSGGIPKRPGSKLPTLSRSSSKSNSSSKTKPGPNKQPQGSYLNMYLRKNSQGSEASAGRGGSQTDQVKTYNTEGTPLNFSATTSLSDLSVADETFTTGMQQPPPQAVKHIRDKSRMKSWNIASPGSKHSGFDSPCVYNMEGTPTTFSRNDSLSSLSCDEGIDAANGKASVNPSSGTKIPKSKSSSIPKKTPSIPPSGKDTPLRFNMEGTPANLSGNSSLSSLDMEEMNGDERRRSMSSNGSSNGDVGYDDKALLDECIYSAMPSSSKKQSDKPKTPPKQDESKRVLQYPTKTASNKSHLAQPKPVARISKSGSASPVTRGSGRASPAHSHRSVPANTHFGGRDADSDSAYQSNSSNESHFDPSQFAASHRPKPPSHTVAGN